MAMVERVGKGVLGAQVCSRVTPVFKVFETILRTDASGTGLGAVLSQLEGTVERPVPFLSRRLSDVETRYHSNELECSALVWALKKAAHVFPGTPVPRLYRQ